MPCRETKVGKLYQNNSRKFAIAGGIPFPKDARASYGRKNGRRQMERRQLLLHQAVDQNHVNRRSGRQKGDMVGRQLMEGCDIAEVHSSELDGAYPHHPHCMAERNLPDEGEENGQRAGHARQRDKTGGEGGQAVPQQSE